MSSEYRSILDTLQGGMRQLGAAIPQTMQGFMQLHKSATAPGAIDSKTKELMALAIGIVTHCEGCVAFHLHEALKHGANEKEVHETIGLAIMMGGGPAAVYGTKAIEALQQLQK